MKFCVTPLSGLYRSIFKDLPAASTTGALVFLSPACRPRLGSGWLDPSVGTGFGVGQLFRNITQSTKLFALLTKRRVEEVW